MDSRHRLREVEPFLPALLGLVVGLAVLGPGMGRGFLLRVDMVAVPDPPFKGVLLGLSTAAPRAVPSDLVLTLLGRLLPADLAQKLLLLGIFVIAAAGAGALLASFPLAARLTGAFFFCWNPYVAERLLIGHWALLFGYASMPWVLRAVGGIRAGAREAPSWRRITLALLPAAVGGFSAMLVAGILLAGACWVRRSRRAAGIGAAVWLACSLPWLVPSLLGAGALTGDPAGVDAFASRADTPLGTFGSLLMLGGIWNRESVPDRYADTPLLVIRILLTLVALAGAGVLWFDSGLRSRRGLAVLVLPSALGLVIASATATAPGRWLLRSTISALPAAGVFRDAQQFVAPLALLEAVGLAAAAAAVLASRRLREQGAKVYASTLLLLPVIALPQFAWGLGGALKPARYPADWAAVRRIVDRDPAGGDLLVLPWSAYRVYDWNPRTVLSDPAVKAFARRVVASDELVVGGTRVGGEDPKARRAAAVLAVEDGAVTAGDCRALGVRFVLVEGASEPRLQTLRVVFQGPELTLYRVDDSA